MTKITVSKNLLRRCLGILKLIDFKMGALSVKIITKRENPRALQIHCVLPHKIFVYITSKLNAQTKVERGLVQNSDLKLQP